MSLDHVREDVMQEVPPSIARYSLIGDSDVPEMLAVDDDVLGARPPVQYLARMPATADARLAALIDVNRQLMGALAPDELLRLLVSSAMRLFSASGCSVALVAADEKELVFPAVGGDLEGEEIRLPFGTGVIGWVAQSGQPAIVNDVASDTRFFAGVDKKTGFETRSILCVPLRERNAVIGAIEVLNTAHAHGFDNEDLALLEALAGVAATAIERTRAVARLRSANLALRSDAESRYDLIEGKSTSMLDAIETLRAAAPTRSTVLLLGESGVGKEVLARSIHRWSDRADAPFIAVNCTALTAELLESELFGHERGAFTGAITQKRGRFELAQGGTIFLDEIGDLDPKLQVKLLRALQEREFQRVGGTRDIRVDVRVIAATNRDLHHAMLEKTFREDLYYRLAVVSVRVPSLRERREDIPLLAEDLLERFARELGKAPLSFTPDALERLGAGDWPGNVRQLSNTIERAAVLAKGDVLRAADLAVDGVRSLPPTSGTNPGVDPLDALSLSEAVEGYKTRRVRQALQQTGGNQSRAAELLGVRQSNLSRLMKALGISLVQ
ncbi:MAG TPA: sigma 54-interacting transcriptional regulator [Polyangiaceae bacterium]|jgi:Nif-specific regulatory protein|nr:sigma 54-interacting transcriptional regulator [Polyangiaceae bacterium]